MLRTLVFAAALALLPAVVSAHCQIPCGIYDDDARVQAMLEDAQTVAKSARLIQELAPAQDAQSRQQFVRWVNNKETHAQKIIATVADPCAVRIAIVISQASVHIRAGEPLGSCSISEAIPVCCRIPPNAPPAAVMRMIPPALASDFCTEDVSVCRLSRF